MTDQTLPGMAPTTDEAAESLRKLRDEAEAKIPLARRMRDRRAVALLIAEANRLNRQLAKVDGPMPLFERAG